MKRLVQVDCYMSRTIMHYLGATLRLHDSLLQDAQSKWEGFCRTSTFLEDDDVEHLLEIRIGKTAAEKHMA